MNNNKALKGLFVRIDQPMEHFGFIIEITPTGWAKVQTSTSERWCRIEELAIA
jgi:hypothetical protein